MNLMDLFIKVGVKDEASGPIKKLSGAVGNGLKVAAAAGVAAVGAAATAVGKLVTQSVKAYGEYEQLVGGAKKIFDQMDYSVIANDAANAWSSMNLSASEYLSMMNNVGATFAATMGDEKGYDTAKRGMQAIADYASGTGKNVGELNDKFALITRSSQSYQSIADQFSGILPATSKDFLEQAQAAGYLSDSYKQLTEVPIAEYQEAVSLMLEKGVDDLNLTGNTAAETAHTITGSLAGLKATWANLIAGLGDPGADLNTLFDNLTENALNFANNVKPVIQRALKSIGSLLKRLAPTLGKEIPGLLKSLLPDLLKAAGDLTKSLFEALPSLLFDALPQIMGTVEELLNSLVDGIASESGAIGEAVGKVVEMLGQFFADNAPQLLTAGMEIILAIVNGIADNADQIVNGIEKVIDAIIDWLADEKNLDSLLTSGLKIVVALAKGILDAAVNITIHLTDLVDEIFEWFSKGENLQKLGDAGGEIVGALWDGMKAAWPAVARWAGASVAALSGNFSGAKMIWNAGSSNAIGNDYVPYNNYPAMLHRGEAVLTAREADAWRRGENGRQIVNNFSFNGVSQSDLDYIVGYVNRELVSG